MSGKDALDIVSKCFKPARLDDFHKAEPYKMYFGTYKTNQISDKCLCVYFKEPVSYTGEDIVEVHCHGGTKIASVILNSMLDNGAILASKGEFTKRAFLNNKVTLDECEGIIDIINAESTSQLEAAYRLQSGQLNAKIKDINSLILNGVATLEVALDNPEEYEEDSLLNAYKPLNEAYLNLKGLIKNSEYSHLIKNGIRVGIIGLPNKGKSSLLNAITHTSRAIVTDIAGTTRDTIEEKAEYKGYELIFVDTAGIRQSKDVIEKIGIDRAYETAESSSVIVLVAEGRDINDEEKELIKHFEDKPLIIAYNKSDLLKKEEMDKEKLYISAKNNINIDKLLDKIIDLLGVKNIDSYSDFLLNERQLRSVTEAIEIMNNIIINYNKIPVDCMLTDLNSVIITLGNIDGSTASDMVIDEVFNKFCIGK
jgi:tRNA modification GTPase